MKKYIFLFLALITLPLLAQKASPESEIVLSQNTDQILLPSGGVSCVHGDNEWYRNYILDEEGITTPVSLIALEFGVQSTDAVQQLEVYAYEYDPFMDFPEGFDNTNPPAPIASGTVSVGPGDVGQIIRVNFDTPVVVPAVTAVVVSVVQPGTNGATLFLGVTAADTKTNYIASISCGPTQPTSVDNLGIPDSRHLINLVVDDALAVADFSEADIAVYPNPSTDFIHIDLPKYLSLDNLALFDISGKNIEATYYENTMDISGLASGVYFLKINIGKAIIMKKIIKS